MRIDGRANDEIRKTIIEGYPNYILYPEGSILITQGNTRVICNISIKDDVPKFLQGTEKGWLTAEYSMLPSATHIRNVRESKLGHVHGRTQEISRLIGRSLRAIIDLTKIGEHSIIVDCDVIQADGGTRCASITGSYIALTAAIQKLLNNGTIEENPIIEPIAAISSGIVGNEYLLDLCYDEDSKASVDLNCVMTKSQKLVEIQATAEGNPFDINELNKLINLSWSGIKKLIKIQNDVISSNPL
ncbi:MAG: ribonuclease PH [Candidatus Helarchaeota archaeon]